jgi:glycosyltransferase involved in cell wall biosynthesis
MAGLPFEACYLGGGVLVGELAELGVPPLDTRDTTGGAHMRRLLATHPRVVIHTHPPSLAAIRGIAATGLDRVRFIHTEHNVVSSYKPHTRVLHRLTSRRIDELVAVSTAVLASAPNVPRRRVLYHADLATDRMRACLELRFKESGPLRLLCVASLTPKKDHATLFRALERLDTTKLGPVWVGIAGDGPLRSDVEELAASVNDRDIGITAELLGVLDDIPCLLADADVLVLPSKSEGLPLIVMEAMAGSTPVVATAVGGVPELVEHDHTALLVPAEDDTALATALRHVLEDRDLRRSLAAHAREAVIQLTGTSWTDEYLTLIEAP